MKTPAQCPRCGSEIPAGSPEGMCPQCLLGLAAQPARSARLKTETSRTIPRSLMLDGLHRMGWVGIALAVTALGVLISGYYVQPGWVNPAAAQLSYTVSVLGAVLSGMVLFALPFLRWPDPAKALDAGLVLQVVAGFFISLSENSVPYAGAGPIRNISSVAVWIAVFALAAPVSYGKALIAALATASTGPIGLGMQILLGNVPHPPAPLWLVLFSPLYLMAVASTLLGRLIYRLGSEVKAAREYGGYQLLSRLGRGGMGEVWKARHHLIGREAAVKLIHPEVFQTQPGDILAALRRFEREANATAALHSPHTVSLYNYGLSEDGLLYYVMELLNGHDLETLVDRFGPVPAARAIHILVQVCDSLAEAHQAGLIHRDIKPGNILLCPMGTSCDFAKVVDFGLVQPVDPGHSIRSTQALGGTPAYMAPEVLEGKTADGRTDIYSLGCVAYWLLTGTQLFDSPTAPLTMQAHLTQIPSALSTRTDNPIPAELEAAVMACLEKDPARRPASAPELSLRLQACPLERPWTRLDAERWWAEASPERL
jgi:tRNA A-37 threonylcarbamoyl transferase component Bud32